MRKITPLLAFAGLLALAACNRGKEEEAPEPFNNVTDMPVENDVPPPPPEPANETNAANVVEAPPPPPEISEEQQMQDDADATGMTSRLPDEDQMGGSTRLANAARAH